MEPAVKIPQVVTVSYLPQDEPLRSLRFRCHLETLSHYLQDFDHVGTLLSGYTNDQVDKIRLMGVQVLLNSRKGLMKAVKQNKIMQQLYSQSQSTAVLLSDDDVVCYNDESVEMVKQYIDDPDAMPVPCIAPICMGRLAGSFFNTETRKLAPASLSMCGWLLLIRSDFGVLYDMDVLKESAADDLVLRVTAAAMGKLIIWDTAFRARTIKPEPTVGSVITEFGMERQIMLARQRGILYRHYPKLFVRSGRHVKFSYNTPQVRKKILYSGFGKVVDVKVDDLTKPMFVFNEGGYKKWEKSIASFGIEMVDAREEVDEFGTLLHSKQQGVSRMLRKGVVVAGDIARETGLSLDAVCKHFDYLEHEGYVEVMRSGRKRDRTALLSMVSM